MSRTLKLNVKNVILGCHNFSDILAKNDYRILSCFSPLASRKAKPFNKSDCDYYKQDYVKTSSLNHAEAVFPRKLDHLILNRVSSELPVTGKWLNEVQTGPICSLGCGLPWRSSRSFYDVRKNLHCLPLGPKSRPDSMKPICLSPTSYPPKQEKSNTCAKITLCPTKSVISNSCRFYCASPCQPKLPSKRRTKRPCKLNPCGPMKRPCRPVPKCRPMPHTRPVLNAKDCGSGPKKCKPKFPLPKGTGAGSSRRDPCAGGKRQAKRDCFGSGSKKGANKGPVCPTPTQAKRDCFGSGSKKGANKGPVCPTPTQAKRDCFGSGSKKSANKGPVCPTPTQAKRDCFGSGSKKAANKGPICPTPTQAKRDCFGSGSKEGAPIKKAPICPTPTPKRDCFGSGSKEGGANIKKPPICPTPTPKRDCFGSGSEEGGANKGPVCPTPTQAKRDCFGSGSKEGGANTKQPPICPTPTPKRDCFGSGSKEGGAPINKGPICPTPKKCK